MSAADVNMFLEMGMIGTVFPLNKRMGNSSSVQEHGTLVIIIDIYHFRYPFCLCSVCGCAGSDEECPLAECECEGQLSINNDCTKGRYGEFAVLITKWVLISVKDFVRVAGMKK